ncbi:MAG: tRNA modification GTPase mnmE, partial [uncultured bacterium]
MIDTIAAIATPSGRGGVGIVRISGDNATIISEKIIQQSLRPREAIFTKFYDLENREVDEGIALYFQNPHSFTGEDVIELQAHGSPIVLDQLLQIAIHYGARLARPGEFSERAFLNKKIDLTQA